MSTELWNTVAAWGTFLVIAGTCVTAIIQLRHLRTANQLGGLLTTFGILQDPSLRELINFVRHDLQERLEDESFRASLLQTPVDRAAHPELYLIDIYNHIGSFVRNELIDERIYLQTEWYNVNLYWKLLSGVIEIRRDYDPHLFENFEYLATRALAWKQGHPQGDYPPGERRMLAPPSSSRP